MVTSNHQSRNSWLDWSDWLNDGYFKILVVLVYDIVFNVNVNIASANVFKGFTVFTVTIVVYN